MPQAPAVLPEIARKAAVVATAVVEAAYMPVVECVHLLAGGKTGGLVDEVQTVHQAPVFNEVALGAAGAFIPQRRAIERAELAHVVVIEIQREDEITRGPERFRCLAGQAEDEQTLGAQPGGMDLAHRVAHRVQAHAGLVARHHGRIGGLHAHRHHQRAGGLELAQHLVGGVTGADGAVEVHAQRLVDEQPAQLVNPLFLGGEEIVVEIDVMHAEVVAQMLHVFMDVLRRIHLVEPLEHRAIAEGTGVGAAARGDHGRTPAFGVGKQRQVIALREAFELFPGGEGQIIQILDAGAARVADDALAIAPYQIGDVFDRHAFGQVKHGAFALTDGEVVDLGEVRQQRCADGRRMHIAEGDLHMRRLAADSLGHVHRIHETGGCSREADQLWPGGEDARHIGFDATRCAGAKAVMHRAGVAMLFQPGRKLQDADGRHAVGQHGEIRLTGHAVEAGRVNQRDAHRAYSAASAISSSGTASMAASTLTRKLWSSRCASPDTHTEPITLLPRRRSGNPPPAAT